MSRPAQAACAIIAILLILVSARVAAGISDQIAGVGALTRDPTDVAGVPWWAGSISRLTNLCWAVAATVNILAARVSVTSGRRPWLLLGGLCAVIAIDDTLLVHEEVMPSVGVPEAALLAAYPVVGLVLARWFWSLKRTAAGAAVFTGAGMLAGSLVTDAFLAGLVVEDALKLAGALAWCLGGIWAHSERSLKTSHNAIGQVG